MSLPKRLASGTKYLGASAYNCYLTVIDPNSGQAADGTPNAPAVIATNVHANCSPWRTKEVDNPQQRIGQSSFKSVLRYPKTNRMHTGMQLQLRGQIHEIESFYDPDGQQRELHVWTWTNDATAGRNNGCRTRTAPTTSRRPDGCIACESGKREGNLSDTFSEGQHLAFHRLSRVATSDEYTVDGPVGFRNALFQVDCYGDTYYKSRAVADAVREALWSYSGTMPDSDATIVNAVLVTKDWDMPYEEGSAPVGFIYRTLLEFRVFYRVSS